MTPESFEGLESNSSFRWNRNDFSSLGISAKCVLGHESGKFSKVGQADLLPIKYPFCNGLEDCVYDSFRFSNREIVVRGDIFTNLAFVDGFGIFSGFDTFSGFGIVSGFARKSIRNRITDVGRRSNGTEHGDNRSRVCGNQRALATMSC